MTTKKITLILYGADRRLWAGGESTLMVTDVNRSPLRVLKGKELSATTTTIDLELNLAFDAGQAYGVSIQAEGYRTAWQLVRRRMFVSQEAGEEIERSEAILRLMLVPKKPVSPDLNDGYDLLQAAGSRLAHKDTGLSEGEYDQLETAEMMAFLNLESKLRATYIGGRSLLSYVDAVRAVAADRLFLFVQSELKELVERSTDFAGAPGHGRPRKPEGLPAHPDSWKHRRFGAGNIQLSFSEETEAINGEADQAFSVDADIDLERGFGHVLEWMHNNIIQPGRKTDQTLVYALLYSQGIYPAYTLSPA